MIHEYDKIKLDLLWGTLEHDLPTLLQTIAPMISDGG